MSNIQHILDNFKKYLEHENPDLLNKFHSPASDDDIGSLEKVLGCSLDEELKQFLSIHNGVHIPKSGINIYNCKMIEKHWSELSEELDDDDADGAFSYTEDSVEETKGIKKERFNHKWIPITADDTFVVCIDLSPGSGGKTGQVIKIDLSHAEREVLSNSLSEFLTREIKQDKEEDSFSKENHPAKKPGWSLW